MNDSKIGDVLLFFDPRSREPITNEGCNQSAIVIDKDRAIYVRHGVHILRLRDIWNLPNLERRRPTIDFDLGLVARYFLKYIDKPEYVAAGINAYSKLNMSPFIMGDLFPDRPVYKSDDEYEVAWERMVAAMEPYDSLFTVTPGNVLSRFIASYTRGAFSHVAIYDGDGSIAESMTAGTRYVPITVYKSRKNWVAAYRNVHNKGEKTVEQAKSQLNKPLRPGYNYRGAAWAGTKAFFGNHRGAATPNSMIYQGIYSFIGQA